MRTKAEAARLFEAERRRAGVSEEWRLRFSGRMRSTLAMCRLGCKEIQLNSRYAAVAPEEQLVNTIRHELAHVLAGPMAGHGHKWALCCAWLNCSGERCSSISEEVQRALYAGGWEAFCPVCDVTCGHMARRPKRIYRHHCKTVVQWKKVNP